MHGSALTSRRLRVTAIVTLLVLALLPQRYCVYGRPLQQAVMGPLSLLSAPLATLGRRLSADDEPPPLGSEIEALSDEIRLKDALIIALQRRVRELEVETAELQGLERRLGDSALFRRAAIIGRGGDPAAGTFQIDLGAADGLSEGQPVVDRGYLLGRVIEVGRGMSTIKPITTEGTLMEVVLAPPRLPESGLPAERRRTCLLRPASAHLLVDDAVARDLPVSIGDYARLDDTSGPHAWPREVQGMIVGRVIAVEPNPDDPLRKRIQVRPALSLQQVDAVTVIVTRPDRTRPSSIHGQDARATPGSSGGGVGETSGGGQDARAATSGGGGGRW